MSSHSFLLSSGPLLLFVSVTSFPQNTFIFYFIFIVFSYFITLPQSVFFPFLPIIDRHQSSCYIPVVLKPLCTEIPEQYFITYVSGTELSGIARKASQLFVMWRQGCEPLMYPFCYCSPCPLCTLPRYQDAMESLLGYFLQLQVHSLRMSLMLLLKRLKLVRDPSFAKPHQKQNSDTSRVLWPHLVPGYFFTKLSVSKLSHPGTPILTHVSISSEPFW